MLCNGRRLSHVLVASLFAGISAGGVSLDDEQERGERGIQIIANITTPQTPGSTLDRMPVLALIQPRSGKRLPYEAGKDSTLTIQFDVFSNPMILEAIKAKVCVEFDAVTSSIDEEGEEVLAFNSLQDGFEHCFPGRGVELQASGFAPGDYRLRAMLRVPGIAVDEPNFTSSVGFKVVSKLPFEPSYDWVRVEEWQDVQAGLDVKMPIGGNDFRKARIPQEWKVQAFVVDEMGSKKGAGKIHRVMIRRTDTLSAIRAAIAESAGSAAPCVTLSLGGSQTDWAMLESKNLTVEAATLFERGVEIAGVLDRKTDACACHVPEKGRACQVVLTQLESCEKEAGSDKEVCNSLVTPVADCFTRCSLIGDPYAPAFASLSDEASTQSVWSENQTLLGPAIGEPPLPLQKGWSELQWGGDGGDFPAPSQWARCKLCSYTLGTWGRLGFHAQSKEGLPSGVPNELASSRYSPWFRTVRSSHPSQIDVLLEQYDEASPTCGAGKHVIASPTFIVPVYDILNVHHLITELILPLFRTIVNSYGAFRNDTLIFLELGHEEQAPRLQQLLKMMAIADLPLQMLAQITKRTIGSAASFEQGIPVTASGRTTDSSEKRLCFRDLHLGLNLEGTLSAPALRTKLLDPASPDGLEASRWQQLLRDHFFPLPVPVTPQDGGVLVPLPVGILFVKRLHTRKFKNFIELKGIARDVAKYTTDQVLASTTTTSTTTTSTALEGSQTSASSLTESADGEEAAIDGNTTAVIFPPDWKGWINEVVMERLPFSQQIEQLHKSTVLVAMLGQGAFNAAFMRPGSSLVLVVPEKLNDDKFIFANIAIASGLHAFLLESGNQSASGDGSDNKDAILMKEAKNEKDVWVDPARFKPTLHLSVNYASACSFQPCESPPVAHAHFWPEVEEYWTLAEKQMAADLKQAQVQKQAIAAQKKAEEEDARKRELESQMEKARARVAELEKSLEAMTTLPSKSSGHAGSQRAEL